MTKSTPALPELTGLEIFRCAQLRIEVTAEDPDFPEARLVMRAMREGIAVGMERQRATSTTSAPMTPEDRRLEFRNWYDAQMRTSQGPGPEVIWSVAMDRQQIADDIRTWFAAAPSTAGDSHE